MFRHRSAIIRNLFRTKEYNPNTLIQVLPICLTHLIDPNHVHLYECKLYCCFTSKSVLRVGVHS